MKFYIDRAGKHVAKGILSMSDATLGETGKLHRERALLGRPAWMMRLESRLAARVPVHPNTLSALKLVVLTPAILAAAARPASGPWLVPLLFLAFAALDYLDGVVAREKNLATGFGRVFDRLTDYPLLVGMSYHCKDVVPWWLVATKIALDLSLLALYAAGRGSTQNRIRTAMSGAAVLGLWLSSHGGVDTVFAAAAVRHLLVLNIGFTALVALHNLGLTSRAALVGCFSRSTAPSSPTRRRSLCP